VARDTWNRFEQLDPTSAVTLASARLNPLWSIGRHLIGAVIWGVGAMSLVLGSIGVFANLLMLSPGGRSTPDAGHWILAALFLGAGKLLLIVASKLWR
jgi:hypothetical protein